MPEVVGDARAAAFFGEHAGLQRFLQQVEDDIFVSIGAARLHCQDSIDFKGAAQHGGAHQQALAGAADPAQAQVEHGGDGIRQCGG